MSSIIAADEHYFGHEMTVGFSETKLGDLTIKQRELEGATYNSFSHRLKVEIAPENGVAKAGDEILVSHFVLDQTPTLDKDYLVAYVEQIFAIKRRNDHEEIEEGYLEDFDALNGFLAYPHSILHDGKYERLDNAQEFCEENYAKTICGKEIEYMTNADYEFFHNETRVHYIKEEKCYLIDNKVNSNYFTEVFKEGEDYLDEDGNLLFIYNSKVFESISGRFFSLNTEIGGKLIKK